MCSKHSFSGPRAFRLFRANPLAHTQNTARGITQSAADIVAPHAPAVHHPEQIQQHQYNWHRHWYPVSWEKDLHDAEPNVRQLLGQNLAVWKDPAGNWNVFSDVCPHRLVPLSEGRVNQDGHLECPYHGWAFSAGGKCEAIPQGGDINSPRSAATSYPCIVKQGLLWVWPSVVSLDRLEEGPDESDIPILPEAEPGSGWDPEVSVNTFRIFPYDMSTLVENLADPGHVPFTHHATVSKRSTSSIIDLKLTAKDRDGFDGVWEAGPRQGKLGTMTTKMRYPTLLRHTIDAYATKGFANITATYCVPLAPGRSCVFVRQPFRFKSRLSAFFMRLIPEWITHIGNNKVLEDDVIFLHQQEPNAVAKGLADSPIGRVYNMPGASDTYVTTFRTWLRNVAGGGPFGPQDQQWLQAAGPRLDQEALLDRFHSHTKYCKACTGALHNTRWFIAALGAVQSAVLFVAAVAAAGALYGGRGVPLSGSAASQPTSAAHGAKALISQWFTLQSAKGLAALRSITGALGGPLNIAVAALLIALCVLLGRRRLRKLERSFLAGDWPPPRNTSSVV